MATRQRGAGMKVYLDPPEWLSRSIHRIAKALADAAPAGVKIVKERRQADLEIIHAIGTGSIPSDLGVRPYAMTQLCLRTTENPLPSYWAPLWRNAVAVWSYFDLVAYLDEFGESADFLFYHAPLGVDGRVFDFNGTSRDFKLGTSGYVASTECVGECDEAVRQVGGKQFHLGPEADIGLPGLTYALGIDDGVLAQFWARCERVSGLRRGEGFELPAYEGLACGARPLVFDLPCYRHWLGEAADFVPHVPASELVPHLAAVLSEPPRPVSRDERAAFLERHQWATLAGGFWERAL